MLWVLALHIIFMVCWFAALFYLPRLFVYHANCVNEPTSHARFQLMQRRLYRGIMLPSALLTSIFGFWLLAYNWAYYQQAGWMHAKLFSVVLLWAYTIHCGIINAQFARGSNKHSSRYYRFYNEIPTLLLFIIVILVVVKPF